MILVFNLLFKQISLSSFLIQQNFDSYMFIGWDERQLFLHFIFYQLSARYCSVDAGLPPNYM